MEWNVHVHTARKGEGGCLARADELPRGSIYILLHIWSVSAFKPTWTFPSLTCSRVLILVPLELLQLATYIAGASHFFTATTSRDQVNCHLSQPGILQASAFCHLLHTKVYVKVKCSGVSISYISIYIKIFIRKPVLAKLKTKMLKIFLKKSVPALG